jgi:hypothetical protein
MFITHIHAVKCAFELQSRWSHSQSWWCASFQHSFKCNYVITSFKSHSHVGDCLFPFQGPLYCPQVVNFSRSVKKFWCHSCQGFCKLNRYSSCLTIFLFWNQLSYFKDHVYSKSSLLKWNQRCPFFEKTFWKSSFFFFKDPTHVIRNIQSFDCHVFWKQKLTCCKTKMVFFMVLCIHFRLWFRVYLLMVCNEVTFC